MTSPVKYAPIWSRLAISGRRSGSWVIARSASVLARLKKAGVSFSEARSSRALPRGLDIRRLCVLSHTTAAAPD